MGETKITTVQLPVELNELINKLAIKKAQELNIPKLSKIAYIEMTFRNIADKELK